VSDQTQKELESIKKLLILLLVKLGTTSDEIGDALGLSSQRVRQLVAIAKIKKIAFSGSSTER
jgi:DNA-binding CsgD family transcriptional regulator